MAEHPGDEELLAGQRVFYERRAPEYDEWWQRRGRYDQGSVDKASWDEQVRIVEEALKEYGPSGDVLEVAGGTGWWTSQLVRTAERLTVLDSSARALALNRRRNPHPDVRYVLADVFTWSTRHRYDLVFFSFWLSHVPRSRFRDFWTTVASVLLPGGRVFLIDNRHDPSVPRQDPYVLDHRDDVQLRRLSDGSQHAVVKVFYEPGELEHLLQLEGWEFALSGTARFIYGGGHPLHR